MEQMQMNMPDMYDAALYLRLSKDDMEEGGAKSESNSIANQRELLRSFVKSQPDIQIFDIYVDDGYSGGNFDRPEFKRMTTDIEAGKVNCVIVKDLSRFGREYIEAGRKSNAFSEFVVKVQFLATSFIFVARCSGC